MLHYRITDRHGNAGTADLNPAAVAHHRALGSTVTLLGPSNITIVED